jgi:1,4-alpha-glucan branching enzyme
MGEKVGSFCIVLHAHLPWVLNHGVWPHGTNWVNEAAAETYIPLVMELNKLIQEGYNPKLTIDITPVLCEMLASDVFKAGFIEYCSNKVDGANSDLKEFEERGDLSAIEKKNYVNMAKFWIEFYSRTIKYFKEDLNQDILKGFRILMEKGHLDITTCAATHGYAPLLSRESSIHAQFKVAVDNYKKHFGREPMGTWLAECAYRPRYNWKAPVGDYEAKDRPGIETFLSKNGIKYFFIDTALLMGGTSQGVYAARFPLLSSLWEQFQSEYKEISSEFPRNPLESYVLASQDTKNPVAIFTRDENTGLLVWSGEHGYPATGGAYLDFHKKHFKDSMGGGSGLRYWKITSPKADLGSKLQYYMPDIEELLNQNAGHFKEAVKGVLNDYKKKTGKNGFLISPYDAELFGHWWFEGPWFINRLVRYFSEDSEVEMTNCRDYLEKNGMPEKTVQISEGSWGQGSSHYIWLNKDNTWTWKKIYEIENLLEDLITKNHDSENSDLQRLMKQLCRENLVMQSSDWQFLISTWSARDYAENRFTLHYDNCKRLISMINRILNNENVEKGEWEYLARIEEADSLFQEIDIKAWIKDAHFE